MHALNRFVLGAALLLMALAPLGNAQAQQGSQYFPETGHTVSGRFLQYWQDNGGLAVFGYPLTDQQQQDGRAVQYFERQRFELHSENQPPYDVLLGRLGAEVLQQRGVDWTTQPKSPGPAAGCFYFPETQHNVCNQERGTGFLNYWTTHGLEFEGNSSKSYRESLALFGYPITEPYQYTDNENRSYQVQWFERARFEWHPENGNPYKVLLGRLGAEVLPGVQPPPPGTVSSVNVYLIALGDNGQSGKKIGCNDSVVPVQLTIQPTAAPLSAALEQLLAIKSQYYGQSGLYNALYQSNLRLDNAVINNGTATVYLSGGYQIGGVCDAPRFGAQIRETMLQFPTVNEAVVFINGQRLENLLSGQ